MIRYITRHGQTVTYQSCSSDDLYPPGDIPLCDLGRTQAHLLGKRMKELGFKGRIISSPYMRTLETSEIIAKITDTKIVPFAPVREIIKTQSHADDFVGLTIEQIREKYDCIDEEAELEYPWWHPLEIPAQIETAEEVHSRVRLGLELLESIYPNEELLIVGHGATVGAMLDILEIPKEKRIRTMRFNCSLSAIDTTDPSVPTMYCNTAHIPYELTTSNYKTREEIDKKFFDTPYAGEIDVPNELEQIQGTKILHIGDTVSYDYPYYIKLIQTVNPDIIIHTGDTADEVKVGRIPGTEYEYVTKIRILLRAMQESGARLILVPGNNDLADEMHKIVPNAEVYPENTVLTIDGIECRIGHQLAHMTYDKNWHFYGHGKRGEEWSPKRNVGNGPFRFNAKWGAFVVCLTENKFFRFKLP